MAEREQQSLAERILTAFGLVRKDASDKRAKESYVSGYEDGLDEPPMYLDGKPIGRGYRRMKTAKRDLTDIAQDRAIDAAYRVWMTNPLGKAMTEIVVDYVLGDGAVIEARHDDVQMYIDMFWKDPVNKLEDELAESLTREIGMFGELLILTFPQTGEDVNAVLKGRVRLATVDPASIEAIISDENNPRDFIAVELKKASGEDRGKLYKIIKSEGAGEPLRGLMDLEGYAEFIKRQGDPKNENRLKEAEEIRERVEGFRSKLKRGARWREVPIKDGMTGKTTHRVVEQRDRDVISDKAFDGECFFFQTNKVSTGLRGRPDLLPSIDWLDKFDQIFFDGAEHIQIANQLVWEMIVEGGSSTHDDPDLNLIHQANTLAGVPAGGVFAHNEDIELKPNIPRLSSYDLKALIRSLRVLIVGGQRIPEHWVAEGGEVTRTTAQEMGQPTFKMLIHRQNLVKRVFTTLIRYQLDVAVALGKLKPVVTVKDDSGEEEEVPAREAFEVKMPDINVEDTQRSADAFSKLATAVIPLYSASLISLEDAVELVAALSALFGVKVNVKEVVEAASDTTLGDAQTLANLQKIKQKLFQQGQGENGNEPTLDDDAAIAEAVAESLLQIIRR